MSRSSLSWMRTRSSSAARQSSNPEKSQNPRMAGRQLLRIRKQITPDAAISPTDQIVPGFVSPNHLSGSP